VCWNDPLSQLARDSVGPRRRPCVGLVIFRILTTSCLSLWHDCPWSLNEIYKRRPKEARTDRENRKEIDPKKLLVPDNPRILLSCDACMITTPNANGFRNPP